jgi:DHA1 family bicyclomycin/chloramphenicol resistance-like MFS transporter
MVVVIPTLAAVAGHYSVTPGHAQFLIAAYLFGLGAGQPVSGTLADRYGRRPVILAGFMLFTAASVACAIVASFQALIATRFVQALGVSVGTVGSRAIVRDTHDSLGAAQALAWIGAAMGVAPVIGPVVGGALGAWAGPPAVFGASAVLGSLVTGALALRLQETRLAHGRDRPQPSWRLSYGQLLTSRAFMGYTLMYAFTQGCFFAFLAVAAIVFQDHLGLGQQQFGVIWGVMGLAYVSAAAAGTRLIGRFGPRHALRWANIAAAGAGWALAAATALWGVTVIGLILPLLILMGAAGVQTPLAIAGAVNQRPDISGTASGLSSSLALVVGGAFSILSGYVYTGSFMPIAVIIATSATLTLITGRMADSAPTALA